ncbi:hypothetical protein EDB81DRAFT_398414 [Dactylonectria macrodidyma]|uniref:HD domain-containing protein n=1 Tax=Dactylonectria macrodidyma TaxID=307937 RepID=A0A9P9F9J5_9HYPO|nr:hypothetical protein EDB81DRAFT_398414 [Dactylonectria macrodidyma]
MASNQESANGWTAVPVDASAIFKGRAYIHPPEALTVDDVKFPSYNPTVASIQEHAKTELPKQTYNHSMRVYYFATAILKQFPDYGAKLSPTTLALTCLLHDIGTSEENLSSTRMSFEFYGAIQALNLLRGLGSTADQAEAVCEAIIRHQDLGTEGTITFLGQVIQLATIYDNVGKFEGIIHHTTLEDVNKRFPREGWLGCFANTIREEKRLKPWCHSTHIANFEAAVQSNQLMKPYE